MVASARMSEPSTPDAIQTLRSEIDAAARMGFPFYVYELSDQHGAFYVGKGTKARVLQHRLLARDDRNQAKSARIRAAGQDLRHTILAYFVDAAAALRTEAELIRACRADLCNIAPGCRDGRQIVIDQAKDMLDRMLPFERSPLFGCPGGQRIYLRLRGELIRQSQDPTPRTITVNSATREVVYGW